jgi:hypothetical protein
LPDTLAHSPGRITEHFATPMAALAATERLLSPLPEPLRLRWLAAPDGHIVLNPSIHTFSPGPNQVYKRTLQNVAWVRASDLVDDPVAFLAPAGQLIHHLILDRWQLQRLPASAVWAQFWGGVQSCHRAGYAGTVEARADAGLYLAEGIARWLADRRAFNLHDPRLEKLLAATIFDASFYKNLV